MYARARVFEFHFELINKMRVREKYFNCDTKYAQTFFWNGKIATIERNCKSILFKTRCYIRTTSPANTIGIECKSNQVDKAIVTFAMAGENWWSTPMIIIFYRAHFDESKDKNKNGLIMLNEMFVCIEHLNANLYTVEM